MRNDDFDFDLDLGEEPKQEKKFSFNDLDLGLDFDLSFLDDIDESVLEEEKPAPKAPTKKPQNPAPAKKAAPAQKSTAQKAAPATQKAAPAGQKPAARKAAPGAQTSQGAQPGKKPAARPVGPNGAPAKKQAAPQQPQHPPVKKKKGPRVGSVIFYTLYFMFILVFFVATYFGLNWLKGWLNDYELSQPTLKAQQVFDEVFTNPDWGSLYDAAGAQDSPYEGKEEYVTYMNNKVAGQSLTYMETSAGLSGGKKYIVYLGNEKVASFTLTDKNSVSTSVNLQDMQKLEDLESLTNIPNWTLSAVEVFFQREGSYRIVKMDGMTAYINGVALDESYTIQEATTLAEDYLPEGTTGFVTQTQEISGLMEQPDVTVTDKDGNNIVVSYDESTRTFTAQTESNTISDTERELALEAAKVSSKWMIEAVTDRGTVAKYFDPSSTAYNNIVKSTELWMQDYSNYRFENDSVTDYARYSDDIFSVRVSTTLIVTRINGTEKEYAFDQSMFFHKTDSGNWRCFETTNKDVSQPVGRVRLTFMSGDTQLTSDFYDTSSKEIITPIISVPEGQVFSGWVTIGEDSDGNKVYNLEFQPDATTGKVAIPDGTTLKPMTLYALLEDAATASVPTEATAETTAETAPESVPETT